jgi:hypothetical protein
VPVSRKNSHRKSQHEVPVSLPAVPNESGRCVAKQHSLSDPKRLGCGGSVAEQRQEQLRGVVAEVSVFDSAIEDRAKEKEVQRRRLALPVVRNYTLDK